MEVESSPKACHLLRIPPEIRTNIYRNLLSPHFKFHLDQLTMLRTLHPPHGSDSDISPDLADNSPWPRHYHLGYRHTAMLRTNRLIYSEAGALLYSETIVVLRPSDLDFPSASPRIWRHNPVLGIGEQTSTGEHIYASQETGGVLEPHVFSRFQNLELVLDVRDSGGELPTMVLTIDSDGSINPISLGVLKSHIRNMYLQMFEDVTEIVSNSVLLKSFFIKIFLDIGANPWEEMDVNADYDEHFLDNISKTANDAVIEPGVFYLLKRLANVKDLTIKVLEYGNEKGYHHPDGLAGDIVHNIVKKVKHNFNEKAARTH